MSSTPSSQPTLALCIPAYNAAAYLPRLLQSAMAQTVPFDEIWVYDDCSWDATAEVAAAWGARVVRGETNQGCSVGKNVLAQHTTCDWIHFHDADDALYSNFVEQAHTWMTATSSPDVVLFNYEVRSHDTNDLIGNCVFDRIALEQDAIAYTIRQQVNPFCGLYRRSAYLHAGGYDIDPLVLYNEDVAFHCRLAIAGLRFSADPTVAVINYHRSNSMSAANQARCIRAQFHVMRKVADAVGDRYGREIAQKLWHIAGVAAAYLDWEIADQAIQLAIALNGQTDNTLSFLFRTLCQLNPYLAIRLREYLIRWLKPQLRHYCTGVAFGTGTLK